MKRAIIILFVLVWVQGCATSYQSNGLTGGYSETQLDENLFNVTFKGNGYTSRERAEDFTLMRSAELAIQNGYNYFQIIKSEDHTKNDVRTRPTTTTTKMNVSGKGNSASGEAKTRTTGGNSYTVARPSTSNTILCFKDKPDSGFSYNAEFIYKSISKKYGINAGG